MVRLRNIIMIFYIDYYLYFIDNTKKTVKSSFNTLVVFESNEQNILRFYRSLTEIWCVSVYCFTAVKRHLPNCKLHRI